MDVTSNLALVLIALGIEAVIGYPPAVYARLGHPVTWIGALIRRLDQSLNRPEATFARRRLAGVAAFALLLTVTGLVAVTVSYALSFLGFPVWLVIVVILTSTLFAQRSLDEHVAAVRDGLTGPEGLAAGRRAVSMIVGRNTSVLDEAGVARAAIESLAENFSDGITAPVFWTAVAGLPGAALYKATNTADSMIGHKSERYHAFGWAAARFDDLVNLPASRLTALLLVTAAAILPGYSARDAVRAVWRDAGKHKSPNAGWPEAAMAGALGLKLNGPRQYGDELIDDVYMGDGRREATAADIARALRLYRTALGLQFGLYAALLAFIALR